MNKKEVTGTATEAQGKVEEAVGKVTGNKTTQARGKSDVIKGRATKDAGRLEGNVKAVVDDVNQKIQRATE